MKNENEEFGRFLKSTQKYIKPAINRIGVTRPQDREDLQSEGKKILWVIFNENTPSLILR